MAECASIIGITNAPTKYNPYLNPENNKERQELILSQMLKFGMITQEEHDAAVAQKLVFVKSVAEETDDEVQSYFVDQVIDDVIDDLAEQKGVSATVAEMMLYNGGYNVYTTVDLSIQNIMEQAFLDEENFPDIVSSTGEKLQAAMTIVDPYTGNVLAMVGGRGEKTVNRAFNRAASALRQPGSSIKPISVYGPALELGLITPYSVIDDTPMFVRDGKAYPKNYDYVYRGRITAMRAVELSVNAVAYRVVDMVTPEYAFQFAKVNMGLNTLVDSRTLSDGRVVSDIGYAPMSLGGLTDGVTTEEMAASYATFVNNGVYTAPRTYTLVTDADGNTVIDNQPESHVAISEATAYYMNTMLKSVVVRGTGTRAKLPNVTVAGKTGTTDNDFDRWFAGYSAYYTGVVWVGYDTPDEIKYSGVNPALKLWQVVMEQVHEGLEDRAFSEPDNLVTASYCLDSGDAPSAYCALDPRGSRIATGVFVSGDEPKKTCAVHVMTDICTETGKLATPYCPETKRVALLDIRRYFGVGGVVVQDEGYTLRTYNAAQSVPEGMYAAVAPSGSINEFCDVHTEEWAAEQEPETSPEVSPSPGDPGSSPDVSPSPGESPVDSPSPSISPSMFPSAPVVPSPSPGFGN